MLRRLCRSGNLVSMGNREAGSISAIANYVNLSKNVSSRREIKIIDLCTNSLHFDFSFTREISFSWKMKQLCGEKKTLRNALSRRKSQTIDQRTYKLLGSSTRSDAMLVRDSKKSCSPSLRADSRKVSSTKESKTTISRDEHR